MIPTGKALELLDIIEDIARPLPTESWMRVNDPAHDIRVIRRGNSLTIIAESEAAKTWLNNLQDDILPDLAWKLRLLTPEDIQEAEEELCKQAEWNSF